MGLFQAGPSPARMERTLTDHASGNLVNSSMSSLWMPPDLSAYGVPPPRVADHGVMNTFPAITSYSREETHQHHIRHAERQADEILEEARRQADEIVRNAQASIEEVNRQAYEEGLNRARQELASSGEAAQNILNSMLEWREELMNQSQEIVLGLVRTIAQMLFTEGFEVEDAVLQKTFSHALINARTLGELRIFLNPGDAANLDPSWRDFQTNISNQRIQLFPSENIRPGGCFIDGINGTVDARIETRLQLILDALDEEEKKE